MMIYRRFVKKGLAAKDREGQLVLVNEDKEMHQVDETAVAIWDDCDGKTFGELLVDTSVSSGRELDEVIAPLEKILSRLEQNKLIA